MSGRTGTVRWPAGVARATTGLAAALALAMLGGCSAELTPAQPGTIPIAFPSPVPPLRLVLELAIGDAMGGPQFGNVSGLAVDEQGNIYVTDQTEDAIRVFDAGGALLRIIGGRGDGPGEFRSARWLGVLDDTVFVADSRGGLHRFSGQGVFLGTLHTGDPLRNAREVIVAPAGIVMVIPYMRRGNRLVVDTFFVRVLDRTSGLAGEPILRLGLPKMYRNRDGMGSSAPAGAPWPYAALAPDGRVFSTEGEPFTITVTSPRGETLGRASAVVPRVEVSTLDVDWRFRSFLTFADAIHRERPDRAAYSPRRSKYRAPVGPLLVDAADNLLVQRRDLMGMGPDSAAPIAWDLVLPGWRVTGRFYTSFSFRARVLRGCQLYGTVADDMEVPSIVRYRMEPCPLAAGQAAVPGDIR